MMFCASRSDAQHFRRRKETVKINSTSTDLRQTCVSQWRVPGPTTVDTLGAKLPHGNRLPNRPVSYAVCDDRRPHAAVLATKDDQMSSSRQDTKIQLRCRGGAVILFGNEPCRFLVFLVASCCLWLLVCLLFVSCSDLCAEFHDRVLNICDSEFDNCIFQHGPFVHVAFRLFKQAVYYRTVVAVF